MSNDAAPRPPGLPAGLDARPLGLDDAREVWGLLAADELETVGFAEIEEADVLTDWQLPSRHLASSTVGIFAEGADLPVMIGYAEVLAHEEGCAVVAAEHRGRGVGTWLARWMAQTARTRGEAGIGMAVPQDSPGDLLLAALGFRARWESWFLELPAGAAVPAPPLPAGHAVRTAREDEYAAAWTVNEDAFAAWLGREQLSRAEWLATVVGRPGFVPWHLRVAVETGDTGETGGSETGGSGDTVVGMAHVHLSAEGDEPSAHVARLATRADRRGRGLGQALLADAFAAATARGAARCTLATDSRTGALGLYERVGMRVASTWVHRHLTF